jgi:hypothetical protein
VVKTVRVGLPVGHALGRIATQRQEILDTLRFQSLQNATRFVFRLADYGQVTHHFQTATAMNRIDQIDGFFARASARPVRNGTKARMEPLNDFDFVKEVFLAFVRLWRKELDRESQPCSSIEVG